MEIMVHELVTYFIFIITTANTLASYVVNECSMSCVDYHPICAAVDDPLFHGIYLQKLTSGDLGYLNPEEELPPFVDCDSQFYSLMCPLSCGKCTPCYELSTDFDPTFRKYSDRIQNLTEELKTIRRELTEKSLLKAEKLESWKNSFKTHLEGLTNQKRGLLQQIETSGISKTTGTHKLEIKRAEASSSSQTNSPSLDQSFDGILDQKCFYSDNETSCWIHYYLGDAIVDFVRVLSSPQSEIAARNYEISVCNPLECVSCGLLAGIQKNQFKSAECRHGKTGTGVYGDTIRVTSSEKENPLDICEIEVFGKRSVETVPFEG